MNKPATPTPPSFPALVQQFFTEYLVAQRAVSPGRALAHTPSLEESP